MNKSTYSEYGLVGIESVKVVEFTPVARVDVMTRSQIHASMLESEFQVRPYRFSRGGATLHAFPRLPAASARKWLEAQGIAFTATPDGFRQVGLETWVQGGCGARNAYAA